MFESSVRRKPAAPAPSPLARPPEYFALDAALGLRSSSFPPLRETTPHRVNSRTSAPESIRTIAPQPPIVPVRTPSSANPPQSLATAANSTDQLPSKSSRLRTQSPSPPTRPLAPASHSRLAAPVRSAPNSHPAPRAPPSPAA